MSRLPEDAGPEREPPEHIQAALPADAWPAPAGAAGRLQPGGSEPCYCLRCSHPLRPYRLHDLELPCCPECRLPYDPDNPDTYRTAAARHWLMWLLLTVLVVINAALVYAVIFFTSQAGPMPQLGSALFLAVPFSLGALLGYLTRPGVWGAIVLSVFAVFCTAGMVCYMGLHGMFCGATLGFFAVVPAVLGALVGWGLRLIFYKSAWDGRRYFFLLGLAGLPLGVDQVERKIFPMDDEVAEVRTEAVFAASPDRAWDSIVFYEEVMHEPPWLLKLSLPRPVRAEGNKSAVGDVERCVYRNGHLVKVITECRRGERLAFRITEQHLHFERDVTLRDGAFLLEPLEGGRTRVVLTTRYQRHLRPAWLWEWMEREVVHTLHGHVLEGMRRELQAPMPETPTPEDAPRLELARD